MQLLCLSNGHGEDEIAVRILRELQQHPHAPRLAALPIVGEGHAYKSAGIPLIGSVQTMPSGGFIYMDGRQLARDIRGGLLQLTRTQIQAIRQWGQADHFQQDYSQPDYSQPDHSQPDHSQQKCILAVGDIVPLLFAWLSGVPYAFVGTAKSEYYLRDERGWLPRQSWFDDRLQRWTGCIYHPWERWLMTRPNCKAVFPRDRITTQVLKRFGVPAFDLGNPMMDGLSWKDEPSRAKSAPSQAAPAALMPPCEPPREAWCNPPASLTIVLLPGSRQPEAYANWETILVAISSLHTHLDRPLQLLAAIAPGLELDEFRQSLLGFRWQQSGTHEYTIGFSHNRAVLELLAPHRFAECIHRADLAIAMAGTATEQFVGLGKPAITIPGQGPQFTPKFAEAQTRLLGPSVTLVEDSEQTAIAIQNLLQDPDRLHLIAENGPRRLGEPGAAQRIATCLMQQMSGSDKVFD